MSARRSDFHREDGRGDGHAGSAQDLDLFRRTPAENRDDGTGVALCAAVGDGAAAGWVSEMRANGDATSNSS
jgi:hypothetical protein